MVASLPRDVERGLAVVVREVGGGAGPQQQPHGLGLVLDDAVVERGVALLGLAVQAARVLDQEVHHVERAPGLLGDGVVEAGLLELAVGQRVGQLAAEQVALRAGLQQVLQAVRVHGGLELRVQLPRGAAVGLHVGAVHVLGADVRLALLHGAAGPQLDAPARGLHDLVEPLVGHGPADQQLARADVVEGEGLDLGDVDAHLAVDARALDADDDPEVGGEPGDVRGAATITAQLVGGNVSDVVHQRLLELHQALVLTTLPVVLKGSVQRHLLGVEEDTHPLLLGDLRLRLEVVCPVVGDHVEAEPVLEDWLHLTGEEVDLRRRLVLVGVADLEEAVPDLAPPPLPHVPQPPLRPLHEVALLPVPGLGVPLGLVQGVLAGRDAPVLKINKVLS